MRERRWIELLKDYDLILNYHQSKANKVANALSRRDVGKVNLSALSSQTFLQETIKLKQNDDPYIAKIKEQIQEGKFQEFQTDEKGILWMKVKAEHQRPEGLLQPLEIATWKWEHISMDFVVGLPKSRQNDDGIWVIIDRLTKSAHFLPVRMN
ncbi:uncharacterized protein LOC142525944 [Primulina tabacum]|uniref:uncharacterized protein LOC142525944 n=1 Tax=Primulina tabacum TaxID=48773 RepID=UPI003F5A8055